VTTLITGGTGLIGASLAASDSLEYFRAIDRLIRTGPTGTNLMDLRMVFVAPC